MRVPVVRVGIGIGGTFSNVSLAHFRALTTCKVLTN